MIPYARIKQTLESQYVDSCTIYERKSVLNETTKITEQSEQEIVKNLPCRLSFQRLSAALDSPPGAIVNQSIKLFMDPDITVKPGSKIVVNRNGNALTFFSSGLSAVYPTHQEIILQVERWA